MDKKAITSEKTKLSLQSTSTINIVSLQAKALADRFDQLGGEKFFGKIVEKKNDVWLGERGCLCYNRSLKRVLEIHGDIYIKWKELGGLPRWVPFTDESPCLDGIGRYNHFNHDSATIMWSPQTGAHCVEGDIHKKWTELGWERSYLGYPTSSEENFPDGGRVTAFQTGGIYWWPDTGAIDANDVAVHYTGLICFKETGEISGSDEPYAIMGVVTPFASNTFKSKVYSSVDSNTSRPDLIEVYRGKPNGISIAVALMENDEGDPDKYRKEITKAVQKAHELGTAACLFIPIIGAGIAAVLGPLIQKFVPAIGKGINDLFDFGDDIIGSQTITLTGKEMLLLVRQANNTSKNIGFKFSTNNLRGENANYKVYFGLVPA